ncbi:MAG: hypothetical protein MI724_00695 [Spirochaetales bacterium]|nr:hypothetical protein [Spirochaetales bacterium]
MERYVKVAVPAGVGALVLSVLVGLVAGVSFGTIVVRALAWAALFAGAAVGLTALVERFIPELVDGDAEPGVEATSVATAGTRVNIVVEEDDIGTAAEREATAAGTHAASPVGEDEGDPERGPASAELVEAVEERLADDEEAVMSQAIEEEKHGAAVDVDGGAIDEMPDIGAFAGSFVSSDYEQTEGPSDEEADEAVSLPGPTRTEGSPSGGGEARAGNDPATIARALQTMLKRDGG